MAGIFVKAAQTDYDTYRETMDYVLKMFLSYPFVTALFNMGWALEHPQSRTLIP